jgi:hypothetical protein
VIQALFLYLTMTDLEQLRYPIGRFRLPDNISGDDMDHWISVLENFPARLEQLVVDLKEDQLDTPYRPDGWTIRQVIHHVSDSHHHSYTRFKWALTETNPLIKAYNEADWAELNDSRKAPIRMSLDHLRAVHFKLVYLLRSLQPHDWEKGFVHPETNRLILLKQNLALYAWHSNHHYAHIKNLIDRNFDQE